MPRYTSDPKETTLKLRLSEEMRSHIEKKSKQKGISMSEYMRELILKDKRNLHFTKDKSSKTTKD